MTSKRLELFDKLLAGGSNDPFHHYGRAMELRSLGQKAEALSAFADVTARFVDYVPSYLMGAQLAIELGDPTHARDLCTRGIEQAKRTGNDHAEGELASLLASL